MSQRERFECIRTNILASYRKQIATALGSQVTLIPAPMHADVVDRFLNALENWPDEQLKITVGVHGTRADFGSIFRRGLLIPGENNGVRVVNGSANGVGIYTANLNAAWLSVRFCADAAHPEMLVCAILQTPSVRHANDAQVVFDE